MNTHAPSTSPRFVVALLSWGLLTWPCAAASLSLVDGGLDGGDRVVEVWYEAGVGGGAAAIEFGIIPGVNTTLLSGSVTVGLVEDVEQAIPALNPFTLMPDEGLSVVPSVAPGAGHAFFSFGTEDLAGSAAVRLGSFVFAGPNASVAVVGSYDRSGQLSPNTLPGGSGLIATAAGVTPVSDVVGSFGDGGGAIELVGVEVEYTFPITETIGDFTDDGIVDGVDFALYRDTLGDTVAIGSGADRNRNGVVEPGDLMLWADARIASLPSVSVIPEPTGSTLCLPTALGLLGVRRRTADKP